MTRLEAASRENPGDFDTFKKLDDALVKTAEFQRIAAHWTRYLAVKPDDPRAFLERGGAFYQAGDNDRAIADLQRACTAGLPSGCAGVQHVRSRPR